MTLLVQDAGEIRTDHEALVRDRFLITGINGLPVMAKVNQGRKALEAIAEAALSVRD